MKCISKKDKCCHVISVKGRECCGLLPAGLKTKFINSLGAINATCPVESFRYHKRGPLKSISDVEKSLNTYKRYSKKLEEIIYWLSGEKGEFPIRKEGQGNYYWRTEMRGKFYAAKKILKKDHKN